MRFWLSLHFPLLPLETLRPSWSNPGAYVVMDKEQVIVASKEALQSGVRLGMRSGGVSAIAPSTLLLDRNPTKEKLALECLTMALLQFTPEVTHAADFCIHLDVTTTLRLFGGRLAICHKIRESIRRLGFTAILGTAPTAMGSWLLARARQRRLFSVRRRAIKMGTLEKRLDQLPCRLLPSAAVHEEWLSGIGADHLGALRRLPRAGLVRRTNQQLLNELGRAYGEAPELFEWIKVPLTFSARLETYDRIEHADALLHGAVRLIGQLIGWLVSLQQAVSHFVLILEHERGRAAIDPSTIEIMLAEPAWHEEHLIRLLKERLGRVELIAPVIALRLDVKQVVPMIAPTQSLFPEPGGNPANFNRLLELLTARLGRENVLTPVALNDYRPEVCNAWGPASDKPIRLDDETELLERPFWILDKPIALIMRDERPFYISPLKIIKGPERVEAGWWDDQIAARDYFVAQASDTSCYWIYLERTQEAKWYLHGLYA
ncbi:protein ImuB [Undibacterium sp. GrIS 1.2]|uniref:Y-family DNA polymerase n=1 Tax=Undibacterium sp. GrIS 1.2 TaxID=3143933 RepID=UPI0033965A25